MRVIVLPLSWTLMAACGSEVGPLEAVQHDEFAELEGEAARVLEDHDLPFAERAVLVERLEAAAERAPAADQRGRLALLRLRSLRWLLASVFREAEQDPASRPWLAEHESLVVYSEPAGEWLVNPEQVWKIHDNHRSTPSADSIAWFAVTNGYPGECEGYVPCYANILNWLDGEYLRRHPNGRHVDEAVGQVRSSLDQAVRMLSSAPAKDLLDPATDCGDLKTGLEPLRDAVTTSSGSERSGAAAVIDELLQYCR
jgi:hypothetical protein